MNLTKALKYTIILAAAGFIITAITVYTQRKIVRTYEDSLPVSILGHHVRALTTSATLSLEKLAGGDKSLNFEQHVIIPFQAVQSVLQSAYDGKSSAIGEFRKINDEDTRAMLKEAVIAVEAAQNAAQERWEERKAVSPELLNTTNYPSDVKFQNTFENLEKQIDQLTGHLSNKTSRDIDSMESLAWLPALVPFIVFGLLSFVYYRLQRNNDKILEKNSQKLKEESKRVATLSLFIESVSAGNYELELKKESEDDKLTGTLITMRDKLRQNADDDRKRNWTTTGQAQIGEILRATTANTNELYDNIIRFLVKYTKSNQGGLFILNDDNEGEKYLDLVGCYAFERKKFLQKKVGLGDGLVGQCFLEGDTINLIEVPQEYISITSGLGGSNPNALLIIPMKVNDNVYGVIELASFKKYEEYEIDLVEKLAESIASTISNVKVNDTTRVLLEKTQQQTEEMKSQEEEIRQNMEELEATQEEMRRKQTILEKELEQSQRQGEVLRTKEIKLTESQETLQAIVDNLPRGIFWKDKDLKFMGCNRIFAAVAGAATTRELIGKTDFDMAWSAQAEAYRSDDMEVMRSRKSKLNIEEVNINSEGEESWVRTSKVPIITETGEVVAILGMFEDITALKNREADVALKLKEREDALKELNALKEILVLKKG